MTSGPWKRPRGVPQPAWAGAGALAPANSARSAAAHGRGQRQRVRHVIRLPDTTERGRGLGECYPSTVSQARGARQGISADPFSRGSTDRAGTEARSVEPRLNSPRRRQLVAGHLLAVADVEP